MENNIEIVRQVLKSFGYRHTSSPDVFEKPLGFTRICAEIENHIDNGLILKGKIIAFKNGEYTLCSETTCLLYYTENWNDIDWNTKLNMKDLSRAIADFENELIDSEDLRQLKYFYINKEFTPLNFLTQSETLELFLSEIG